MGRGRGRQKNAQRDALTSVIMGKLTTIAGKEEAIGCEEEDKEEDLPKSCFLFRSRSKKARICATRQIPPDAEETLADAEWAWSTIYISFPSINMHAFY